MNGAVPRKGLLRAAWLALRAGRVNRYVFLLQRAGLKKPLTDSERGRFGRLHKKLVRRSAILARAATVRALQ